MYASHLRAPGSTARSRSRARVAAKKSLPSSSSSSSSGLLVLISPQTILPGEDEPVKTTIEVEKEKGTIRKVWKGVLKGKEEYGDVQGLEWVEIEEGKVLMPGLVDAHVHLNQPGRTAWEGFSSGTLAAISGGVTTIIDMPLNSIPSTTSVSALEVKIQAARLGWENWRSQQEAQLLLGGGEIGDGVGAGWGEGRVGEERNHLVGEITEVLPLRDYEDDDSQAGDSGFSSMVLPNVPSSSQGGAGGGNVWTGMTSMINGLNVDDHDHGSPGTNTPSRGRGSVSGPSHPLNATTTTTTTSSSSQLPSNGDDLISFKDSTTSKHQQGQGQRGTRMLDVYGPWNSGDDTQKGGVWCDVGFWGGVVPGNQDDLRPMVDAGVKGFKCFLIESGVDEFPAVDEDDVRIAMEKLADTGSVILFHAEQGQPIHGINYGGLTYQTFLNSRPDSWEVCAIEMIIRRLESQASDPAITIPTRAHIVHLSSSLALPLVKSARSRGLPLTSETCFHYLFLSSDQVPETAMASTEYKCCPPIRTETNRDALWQALEDGLIDYVVSDHSPCLPEMKKGGFMDAWGGVSGLGLGLSLMWTETNNRNKKKREGSLQGPIIGLSKLVEWCCTRTAAQVGLQAKKGSIIEGADADFAVFDPAAFWEVKREELKFRNKVSPYVGRTLQGHVDQTYLRGHLVFDSKIGGITTPERRLGELL